MPDKTFALLFAIVAALQMAPDTALAEPTFPETRDWIIGRISDHKRDFHVGDDFTVKREVRNLRIGECNMYFEVHGHFEQGSNQQSWVWKYDVEISDIKELEYVPAEAEPYLMIKTHTNSVSFEKNHSEKSTSDTGLTDEADLAGRYDKDKTLPDRMKKAFMHLSKLALDNPSCPKRVRTRTDLF